MLYQIPLQLGREGIKEREDGERGGGGRLFEGGDYFKYFHQRGGGGDYSREATNRGTANIRGNTVYKPKFVGHYFSVELVSEARKQTKVASLFSFSRGSSDIFRFFLVSHLPL